MLQFSLPENSETSTIKLEWLVKSESVIISEFYEEAYDIMKKQKARKSELSGYAHKVGPHFSDKRKFLFLANGSGDGSMDGSFERELQGIKRFNKRFTEALFQGDIYHFQFTSQSAKLFATEIYVNYIEPSLRGMAFPKKGIDRMHIKINESSLNGIVHGNGVDRKLLLSNATLKEGEVSETMEKNISKFLFTEVLFLEGPSYFTEFLRIGDCGKGIPYSKRPLRRDAKNKSLVMKHLSGKQKGGCGGGLHLINRICDTLFYQTLSSETGEITNSAFTMITYYPKQ